MITNGLICRVRWNNFNFPPACKLVQNGFPSKYLNSVDTPSDNCCSQVFDPNQIQRANIRRKTYVWTKFPLSASTVVENLWRQRDQSITTYHISMVHGNTVCSYPLYDQHQPGRLHRTLLGNSKGHCFLFFPALGTAGRKYRRSTDQSST